MCAYYILSAFFQREQTLTRLLHGFRSGQSLTPAPSASFVSTPSTLSVPVSVPRPFGYSNSHCFVSGACVLTVGTDDKLRTSTNCNIDRDEKEIRLLPAHNYAVVGKAAPLA